MTGATGNGSACRVLRLVVSDCNILHAAYMPFLKNGGLFVPTNDSFYAGEYLFIVLQLPERDGMLRLTGQVAWITPAHAQDRKLQGVGVHFRERDNPARQVIEKYLAAEPATQALTFTP